MARPELNSNQLLNSALRRMYVGLPRVKEAKGSRRGGGREVHQQFPAHGSNAGALSISRASGLVTKS